MKLNLSVLALILSLAAIILSVALPSYYRSIDTSKTETGTPSFDLDTDIFVVMSTFTRIAITNNGTATAHNIKVQMIFTAPFLKNWEATEFVSQLNTTDVVEMEIPIGTSHLSSNMSSYFEGQIVDATTYEVYVHITCDELDSMTSFHLENIIT
jgi:hypothetical protein